jgi:hypothetical protein
MLTIPESLLGIVGIRAHDPGIAAHDPGIRAHDRPESMLTIGRNTQ